MLEGTSRSHTDGNGDGAEGETSCPGCGAESGGSPSVENPHLWRWVKLHCAGPCGTQSVTGVSLVLGRSLDLRPPKSFPGLAWGGWWLLAYFNFLLMNKRRRIISSQTGTGLVRSGAFNFFLNCCSS